MTYSVLDSCSSRFPVVLDDDLFTTVRTGVTEPERILAQCDDMSLSAICTAARSQS